MFLKREKPVKKNGNINFLETNVQYIFNPYRYRYLFDFSGCLREVAALK